MEDKDLQTTGSKIAFVPNKIETLYIIAGKLLGLGFTDCDPENHDGCNAIYLNTTDKDSSIIKPNSFIFTRLDKDEKEYTILKTDWEIDVTLEALKEDRYSGTEGLDQNLWVKSDTDFIFKDNKVLGVKKSKNKPKVALLDIQFPNALRAIAKASQAGHEKYKDTDKDYLNFKRVENAEFEYRNSCRRHELDRSVEYIDEDTGQPHIVLKAWNALAELEMHLENKKDD